MRDIDGVTFKNFTATQGPFRLEGGQYAARYMASAWGTMTLQILGPDGSTYITAATAWAANGMVSVYLPPGTYQIATSTITAGYAALTRVPGE